MQHHLSTLAMTNDFSTKDLSCQVEYPTVEPISPAAKENIASCRDVECQGDSRALVVVLIGWAGAEDRNLKKYSDTYLNMGCIVVRFIAPLRVTFLNFDKLPKLAVRAVDILKKWQLNEHPMFFNVFSNGEQDPIAPWEGIELVAQTLQNRGNPVTLVKFEGSAHVFHFKKYPQEYTSAVTKFIFDTMGSYEGPTTFWDEF
ncbi:unnamed protein product [Allacma fusca]|uniref:Transmembrane protein 53 n=2 Tax=Allacma fusca TaxID=39272 RepID=A0A8J2JJI3_9HEXA|nr:unnamed protein product [Allacma fusca]